MEFRTQNPEKAKAFAVAAIKACIPFSYCDEGKNYSFSLDCSQEHFDKVFSGFLRKPLESFEETGDLLRGYFQEIHTGLLLNDPEACALWSQIINLNFQRGILLRSILGYYPGNYLEDFLWTPMELEFIRKMRETHQGQLRAMAPAPDPTPIVDKM